MVVFLQSGGIREKVVVFEQKWLYSGKVVVFGKSSCIQAKWHLWGKVFVFGQQWLYSGKVVVFGKKRL